jgi:hypothetical protein
MIQLRCVFRHFWLPMKGMKLILIWRHETAALVLPPGKNCLENNSLDCQKIDSAGLVSEKHLKNRRI